jgi:hypothetical protein
MESVLWYIEKVLSVHITMNDSDMQKGDPVFSQYLIYATRY